MEKIHWTWKKILTLVAGFLGIGTLVSCYGVYPPDETITMSGTITGEIDGEVKPVPGIYLETLAAGDSCYTDKDGSYEISFNASEDVLKIEDVDGEENGHFKSESYDVSKISNSDFLLTKYSEE